MRPGFHLARLEPAGARQAGGERSGPRFLEHGVRIEDILPVHQGFVGILRARVVELRMCLFEVVQECDGGDDAGLVVQLALQDLEKVQERVSGAGRLKGAFLIQEAVQQNAQAGRGTIQELEDRVEEAGRTQIGQTTRNR